MFGQDDLKNVANFVSNTPNGSHDDIVTNLLGQELSEEEIGATFLPLRTLIQVSTQVMKIQLWSRPPLQPEPDSLVPVPEKKKNVHLCEQCQRSFASKSSLKCHIRKYHDTSMAFICSFCGEAFGKPRLLADHEQRMHSNLEDKESSPSTKSGRPGTTGSKSTGLSNNTSFLQVCVTNVRIVAKGFPEGTDFESMLTGFTKELFHEQNVQKLVAKLPLRPNGCSEDILMWFIERQRRLNVTCVAIVLATITI